MNYINITNFRKNLFSIIENTVKFNETVRVSTKEGNVVLLSESDYDSIMETLKLSNSSKLAKKIQKSASQPLDDFKGEV